MVEDYFRRQFFGLQQLPVVFFFIFRQINALTSLITYNFLLIFRSFYFPIISSRGFQIIVIDFSDKHHNS